MVLLWIAGGMIAALLIVKASALSLWLGESTVLVIVVGLLAGLSGAGWQALTHRIQRLEDRLAALRRSEDPETAGAHDASRGDTRPQTAETFAAAAPRAETAQRTQPSSGRARNEQPDQPQPPPAAPLWLSRLQQWARTWLKQGNLPVLAGVVASLIGIAALLRYASDQGWLSLPVELRLIAIALAACGLLAFGWSQRRQRRQFSLSAQGGAIGILIMTVFAALRLYELLPAPAAFALMVVLVAATLVLALAQRSLALAALALAAGFAAPILVGTGQGNHLVLFSWYLLLSLAVFGGAWKENWTLLYRLGFVFTFVIATLWGVLEYRPALYAGVQGFLIAFFALYAAIPLVQALAGRDRGRLDVVLVFGLPLVAFPLQMLLLDMAALPIAFSGLAVAASYLLMALIAGPRLHGHPLKTSLLALALGFATLAVPFAFSGPVIPLIWAAEGAALVWLGIVQQQRLSRWAGLAMQLLAGAAWWLWMYNHVFGGSVLPVLNGPALGVLAIVLAGLFSLFLYLRAGAGRLLLNALALWAVAWWLLGGAIEIAQHSAPRNAPTAWLAFSGLSVVVLAWLMHTTRLLVPSMALLALILLAPMLIPLQIWLQDLVYAGWGMPAWLLLLGGIGLAERIAAPSAAPTTRGLISASQHLVLACIAATAGWQLAAETLALGSGWRWAGLILVPLMLAAIARRLGRSPIAPASLPAPQRGWPVRTMLALILIWLLYSLGQAGAAAPLPFVPLVNPLDLASVAGLLVLAGFRNRLTATRPGREWPNLAIGTLAALVISVIWLRTAHHWLTVDWTIAGMASSASAQAGLTILWTVIGTVLWVAGSRGGNRMLWQTGAVLLGIVLVKLVLIDRQFLSNLAGIASFLGFGGLLMLVGYLAPAPPAGKSLPPADGTASPETV
ncbi:MAG: DUF2339 domain-containing protein [Wenzhouxiangellaceae bacterium]